MSEIQDCLFGTNMVLVIRFIELASKSGFELPPFRRIDGQL
jgi:hypothetical protein